MTTSGLSQNKAVISLPKLNLMYFGYDNVVEVSFSKRKIKNLRIECDYCDTIRPNPKASTTWFIKPGDSSHLTLTLIRKNGKIAGKQTFKVFTPPTPTMYLDTSRAQGMITSFPKSLKVKHEPHVPLHTVFLTRNWEIRIGNKTFKGAGSEISEEVHDQMKLEQTGVMIISGKFMGPLGSFELKEIFEFAIE